MNARSKHQSAARRCLSTLVAASALMAALRPTTVSAAGRVWSPGTSMQVCIYTGDETGQIPQGASVCCSVYATDYDRWTLGDQQSSGSSGEELDSPLTYEWSATRGDFIGIGPFVVWLAPENYEGEVTISVVVSDPDGAHVPDGDTGDRGDPDATDAVAVQVVQSEPPPDGGEDEGDEDETEWSPDDPIYPYEGSTAIPQDGQIVEVGAECFVAAYYGDLDKATKSNGDTYHDSDPRTFTVQATAGSFPNGHAYFSSASMWGVIWKAPDVPQAVQLTITIDDAPGPHVPAGHTGSRDDPPVVITINLIVGKVNLITDANNNGKIDANDDTDLFEESWGRLVGYNWDDDDGNGVRDKDDTTVPDEDDLAAVTLTVSPGLPDGCKVSLYQSNLVDTRVLCAWQAKGKGTETPLPRNADDADASPIHVVGGAALFSPLHVEARRDTYRTFLRLRLLDPDGDLVAKDKARFTPVKIRPRAAGAGTTLTVFLDAHCLDWADAADIDFGEGITVTSRIDDEYVDIDIAPDAPAGKRDVKIGPNAVLRNGFRVVAVDIAGDIDGDGTIDTSPGCQDTQWEDQEPGLIIGVNDNDSDENGYRDQDNAIIDGEDDLADMRKIQIKLDPGGLKGHALLSCDSAHANHIRIFSDAPWSEAQPIIGPNAGCAHTITVTGEATTLTFHAEALTGGQVMSLRCEFLDTLGTSVGADEIRSSTLGVGMAGGYYIGSLHTFLARPVLDTVGQETCRFVGAAGPIDDTHPAQGIIDLRQLKDTTIVQALVRGENDPTSDQLKLYCYMEGSAQPCMSLEQSIKNNPLFQWIVWCWQQEWWNDYWILLAMGLTDDEIVWLIGDYPDEEILYSELKEFFLPEGVEGDEQYLWVTPKITEPGTYDFTICTSGQYEFKRFKVSIGPLFPNVAGVATTLRVCLSGMPWANDTQEISFGQGITVTARPEPGAVSITVAPDADLGARDVTIGTGRTLPDAFTVVKLNVDISRLLHTFDTVDEGIEATHGSITKVVVEGMDQDPSAWHLPLRNVSIEPTSAASLLTYRIQKRCPDNNGGEIRIYQNTSVFMGATDTEKQLPSPRLSYLWAVEALQAGVVDVSIVGYCGNQEVCRDTVRTIATICEPRDGPIVLVNAADELDVPAAGFEAHDTVAAALAAANGQGDANVVVGRGTYTPTATAAMPDTAVLVIGLGGSFGSAPEHDLDVSDCPLLDGGSDKRIISIMSRVDQGISALRFQSAHSDYGSAILVAGSSAQITISHCAFTGNTARLGGGAIGVQDSSSCTVTDCIFEGNDQTQETDTSIGGGAIAIRESSGVSVLRCVFRNANHAGYGGGGIAVYKGAGCRIENCHFTANRSCRGGGVLVEADGSGGAGPETVIADSTFEYNITICGYGFTKGGGAVYIYNDDCRISECQFVGNSNGTCGGAIACRGDLLTSSGGTTTIVSCQFDGNTAAQGGAVCAFGKDDVCLSLDGPIVPGGYHVDIFECDFMANVGESGRGGAVLVTSQETELSVASDCTFHYNEAHTPGTGEGDGGAIAGGSLSEVMCVDSHFRYNSATDGGGAVYHTTGGNGAYTSVTVSGNHAVKGGAFHATFWVDLSLTDCLVGSALCDPGNTADAIGGGISLRNSELRMTKDTGTSTVSGNYCVSGNGGGIYLLKEHTPWCTEVFCSTFHASDTEISNNIAASGGGVFATMRSSPFNSALSLQLNRCSIEANTASNGILGTTADGVYYVHAEPLHDVDIELTECVIRNHPSAGVTISDYVIDYDVTSCWNIDIHECTMEDNDVGLLIKNSSLYVKHCTFRRNVAGATKTHVLMDESGSHEVDFRKSDFLSDGTLIGFDIDTSAASGIEIDDCNIEGFLQSSGRQALRLRAVAIPLGQIDAQGCYWGHDAGPHDPSDDTAQGGSHNPNPNGSYVSDGADYLPFDQQRNTW